MYSTDALKTKALVRSAVKALLPTDSACLRYSGFGALRATLFTRLITEFWERDNPHRVIDVAHTCLINTSNWESLMVHFGDRDMGDFIPT